MMRNEQNNVIFIDSDCPVCNKFAVYVSRYDNFEKYRFASLNLVTDDKTSIVLISNGRVTDKSSAILKILIGLKGLHVLLGLGYIVPKFIRDFIYDKFWFASGWSSACVHGAGLLGCAEND